MPCTFVRSAVPQRGGDERVAAAAQGAHAGRPPSARASLLGRTVLHVARCVSRQRGRPTPPPPLTLARAARACADEDDEPHENASLAELRRMFALGDVLPDECVVWAECLDDWTELEARRTRVSACANTVHAVVVQACTVQPPRQLSALVPVRVVLAMVAATCCMAPPAGAARHHQRARRPWGRRGGAGRGRRGGHGPPLGLAVLPLSSARTLGQDHNRRVWRAAGAGAPG